MQMLRTCWKISIEIVYTSKVQEIYDLSGNAMSLGQTTKILLPLLQHLGYFSSGTSEAPVFKGPAGLGALMAPTSSMPVWYLRCVVPSILDVGFRAGPD